jgi:uncharacterized membrane protein YdjX (TVP38/TMEM64 family)
MKKQYNHLLFFGLIILVGIALHVAGITEHINLETLKAHRQQLLATVQNHYVPSVLLYILLYILITTFSLPIAAPLTLVGGFLFGALAATLATNIGATMGATLTFLMFRYLFGNTIQKKYHTQLIAFNANIEQYGANYLLLARLIVFIPFFLVNICAGLTNIPLTTFIWTTSLGIIPGSCVYAYAGKQIGTINALSDVFSWPVVLAFSLLIALSVISILIKNYLIKHRIIQ